MPKYGDSKLATAENLEEFAKAIETFAAEFRRLAAKLREYGLNEMDVGLLPTGADGMERLSRFAANAMKCYLDAAASRGLAFGVEAPMIPSKVQDAAEEAARGATSLIPAEPAKKGKAKK